MEKLEKLTPEQEKLMIETRDEWINLAFNKNKEGINKVLFEEGINWLYVDLLNKPKPKVIYCDSWLSCLLTIEIIKKLSKKEKLELGASVRASVVASVVASVRDSVRDSVLASVWASVVASVGDSVGASVGASVWASVRASVWASVGASVLDSVRASVGASVVASVGDSVWASVGASVWASVLDSVRASVGDSVGASVLDSVGDSVWASVGDYSTYNGWNNFGWVSFYDFFEKINVLDNFKFKQYKKLIQSNCFNAYEYENFVFAIQPPTTIERNEIGLLHSVDKPSIEFRDGSYYCFVNGRSLPSKYFESISNKTFTMNDFINENNEEHKSTCIAFIQEKYGDEYLVDFFRENLKEIDTFVDKKEDKFLIGTTGGMNVGVYTLFKGEINNEKIAYIRCYCPSTDRMFFLGVDSIHNNAKDAIASLYRVPSKLKPHIKSISRQGERFSTTLTEEGKSVLKSMSESEISENSTLKGSEYFNLIKYEF